TLAALWQAHPQYGSAFTTVELDATVPEVSAAQ
ncbi:2-amino-4-hydroxy-6-hydroxymethyldihydropteridine diphosphokinase, partial [Xanthomonas vasicola]